MDCVAAVCLCAGWHGFDVPIFGVQTAGQFVAPISHQMVVSEARILNPSKNFFGFQVLWSSILRTTWRRLSSQLLERVVWVSSHQWIGCPIVYFLRQHRFWMCFGFIASLWRWHESLHSFSMASFPLVASTMSYPEVRKIDARISSRYLSSSTRRIRFSISFLKKVVYVAVFRSFAVAASMKTHI
jgi:hypothetical protein